MAVILFIYIFIFFNVESSAWDAMGISQDEIRRSSILGIIAHSIMYHLNEDDGENIDIFTPFSTNETILLTQLVSGTFTLGSIKIRNSQLCTLLNIQDKDSNTLVDSLHEYIGAIDEGSDIIPVEILTEVLGKIRHIIINQEGPIQTILSTRRNTTPIILEGFIDPDVFVDKPLIVEEEHPATETTRGNADEVTVVGEHINLGIVTKHKKTKKKWYLLFCCK